ncbi:MAG TPA: alkaline phosphatase family protein, partial [Chloroflexota bacterium]|nr:alkaline phosphatase family protein [Chloroflexota bacterium]
MKSLGPLTNFVPALLTICGLTGATMLGLSVSAGPALAGRPVVSGAPPNAHTAVSLCGSSATSCPIKHIIFIIKENHSFDNLFASFPGADGTNFAREGSKQVPLAVTPDSIPDITHDRAAAITGIDGGKMDGFYTIPHNSPQGTDYQDSAYTRKQIPDYYSYARHYSLDDHTFATILGESFSNHLALISGQSGGTFDNPSPATTSWGCDAGASTMVQVSNGHGGVTSMPPCFNFTTLGDEASAAGVSWRYYAPSPKQTGYIWNSFDAIRHI